MSLVADIAIMRGYLGVNHDSYQLDPHTLSPIEGSHKSRITHSEALAALERIAAQLEKDEA